MTFLRNPWFLLIIVLAALSVRRAAADDASELVDTVVGLLGSDDKDDRDTGLEQVRAKVPGREATLRFTALLPKLQPEMQVSLLAALADRGDKAAREGVLRILKGDSDLSRAAAYRALGTLGQADDVPTLAAGLTSNNAAEHEGAAAGLTRLAGPHINADIVATAKTASAAQRAELLGILAARHADDTIPDFLADARAPQADVRQAAIEALGQLAGVNQIPALFDLVLAAPTPADRELVERALVSLCDRTAPLKRNEKRDDFPAGAALAVYAKLDNGNPVGAKKLALLPTLGRLGGKEILKMVNAAIDSSVPEQHAAGVAALCNWPNGTVSKRLLELAKKSSGDTEGSMALHALIRVAPLPDKRPPAEKLQMVQAAMEIATANADRGTLLRRASAIRTMDTVHWVLTYFDDPKLAQDACFSIVEMAHHRELRHPNKAEFEKILDRVMATSKDAIVVERARRYKNEQTFKLEKKK
jgi:HEAT repeat protein